MDDHPRPLPRMRRPSCRSYPFPGPSSTRFSRASTDGAYVDFSPFISASTTLEVIHSGLSGTATYEGGHDVGSVTGSDELAGCKWPQYDYGCRRT